MVLNMKKNALALYRKAVKKAIQDAHKQGYPAYQCIDGYIVALYPDGDSVKLEKVKPLSTYLSEPWLPHHS